MKVHEFQTKGILSITPLINLIRNELWDRIYLNLKSSDGAILSFPYSVIAHLYGALPYFFGFEYPGVQSGRTDKLPTSFLLDFSSFMNQLEEVIVKFIEIPGIARSPGSSKLNLNLIFGLQFYFAAIGINIYSNSFFHTTG